LCAVKQLSQERIQTKTSFFNFITQIPAIITFIEDEDELTVLCDFLLCIVKIYNVHKNKTQKFLCNILKVMSLILRLVYMLDGGAKVVSSENLDFVLYHYVLGKDLDPKSWTYYFIFEVTKYLKQASEESHEFLELDKMLRSKCSVWNYETIREKLMIEGLDIFYPANYKIRRQDMTKAQNKIKGIICKNLKTC